MNLSCNPRRILDLLTGLEISFHTSPKEEITYSELVDRICMKMAIDPSRKRLNFSYIPLVVKPKKQSYILDDEDVFVYLTSADKDQRRSILHVEDIKEGKKKASSFVGNFSELSSGVPEVERNPSAVIPYKGIEES
ncbi:hypothetical protein N665_0427s0005 [Sinapis alba]|nr:hypothetical protein N665_0427s0005 [Sinapis alba]